MPFGLGIFLVSNISEPFYDPLGYYEAGPLYFFSVQLQTFGFGLPMMGSHFCMTVRLWTANYLGLTPGFLIMELVALWVSFSSPGCQLPWVGFLSYYMKVNLCLNIPGHSALWSGFGPLGLKIVLYSKYL